MCFCLLLPDGGTKGLGAGRFTDTTDTTALGKNRQKRGGFWHRFGANLLSPIGDILGSGAAEVTIVVQPSDSMARRPIDVSEFPSDQNLPVGFWRHRWRSRMRRQQEFPNAIGP